MINSPIASVLVDDDPRNIKILKGLLTEFCKEIEIVGEANGIEEAEKIIRSKKPALVFLDIEMPYGSGFDLLDRLMPVEFEVIFITAYDNYAAKAFKYCALEYLLKPVSIQELLAAIRKVSDHMQTKDTSLKLRMFFESYNVRQPELQRIAIPAMEGLLFIDMKSIVRCESQGNYTVIYTAEKLKITTTKQIGEFEDLLPEKIFFRIHNSHLVNLNHVKKYFKGRGGYILMEDDTALEVASRRKDSFLNRFAFQKKER